MDNTNKTFGARSHEEQERARDDYQARTSSLRSVGKPIRKKDSMQLLLGQAKYTADLAPQDCLTVKLLRSPHANAIVEEIDTTAALKVDGIEAIYTWKDVDQNGQRYTQAGQTFPEFSPYDRLLLDRHVRFCGDPVAIVAGRDEKACRKAMRLIKVKYKVLEAVLDFTRSKGNPVIVHPEDNWLPKVDVGGDAKRNLVAHEEASEGDIEAVLADCDVVVDRTYTTQCAQQTMMETFRTFCSIDQYGRLDITSSTQIIFHVRRIVANALHIPQRMIRVRKPRIGGGFGAKQTAVSEVYPAFVTWMTKKPSMLVFTREESMTASSPRHQMQMHVRIGANRDGLIRGIDLYTLSNTGAYGEHGPTTVGLSGHKSISLYGSAEAFRFVDDVVYTNHMSSGAYRGYGATQGIFAVEAAVNELAQELGVDPMWIREKNMVREGNRMASYYGEMTDSCALDRCLTRVKTMIGWDENAPVKDLGNGKVLAYGVGMAMQGSGISGVDVGSARLKLDNDGCYTLLIGAADMGTGCDTTLAQVAAEVLDCSPDRIVVFGADTDISPYDSGSYASSTAYVTGKAVEKAALQLREKIIAKASEQLGVDAEKLYFDGEKVIAADAETAAEPGQETAAEAGQQNVSAAEVEHRAETRQQSITLQEIAYSAQLGNTISLDVTETNSSPTSPPPFMVGAVELEIDKDTGESKVRRFCSAVDCGTPLNPNLARVQTEGGILQGIGMALTESVTYNDRGKPIESSLMQYRIPTREDIGRIEVELVSSYEERGPFGAKSIGEVVINTSAPAIQEAVYQATGKRFYTLPVTPEQICMAFKDKEARKA